MPKTHPVPCTKEEIDKILESAMDDDFYYTLFLVAKSTGRRLGEYYNVQVKDINFETNIMETIVLKRKMRVKKEAVLMPEVALHLKQYILRNNLKADDYVFRDRSYRQIQWSIVRYAEKAGIPHKVSFHNFRHYFVTSLLKQGWSYDKVTKLTGHSNPASLISYDHVVASDIKEEALEALKSI